MFSWTVSDFLARISVDQYVCAYKVSFPKLVDISACDTTIMKHLLHFAYIKLSTMMDVEAEYIYAEFSFVWSLLSITPTLKDINAFFPQSQRHQCFFFFFLAEAKDSNAFSPQSQRHQCFCLFFAEAKDSNALLS